MLINSKVCSFQLDKCLILKNDQIKIKKSNNNIGTLKFMVNNIEICKLNKNNFLKLNNFHEVY